MDRTHKNFTIHEFDEVESSNKTAFELAKLRKISDHEVILAKKQSAGKGRQNRNWDSPLGNLYFSLVVRPQISVEKIPQLSFIGIVALRLAIEKIVEGSSVKWPNDLLVAEKKIAGLLLESEITTENCEFAVIGIGINLISNPTQTIFPASNLKDFGAEISPQEMLEKFLDEFEPLYQNWLNFGFEGIRKIWMQRAYRLNENIKLRLEEQEVDGVFKGIDEEGNLLIDQDGEISKISAADVMQTGVQKT